MVMKLEAPQPVRVKFSCIRHQLFFPDGRDYTIGKSMTLAEVLCKCTDILSGNQFYMYGVK